jgi:putative transposase
MCNTSTILINAAARYGRGVTNHALHKQKPLLLACQRYIELNPVRANMVPHPAEYKWSSYRINAQGELGNVITPHLVYAQLGMDEQSRQPAYRELFHYELETKLVDEIRKATNGNYVLGDTKFAEQIAMALGRRVLLGKVGDLK